MGRRPELRTALLGILALICLVLVVQGVRTGDRALWLAGLLGVLGFGTWESAATVQRLQRQARRREPR